MRSGFKDLVLRAGAGWFALHRRLTADSLRIVTYHGVDPRNDPVLNFDCLQADPVIFEQQIESFARVFRVISLRSAVEHFEAEGRWPERGLVLTFDDGYRNNLEVAAPILTRVGVPATFFVTAGFCEGRNQAWWYSLRQWLAGRGDLDDHEKIREAIRLESEWRPLAESERIRRFADCIVNAPAGKKPDPYPFMNAADCRNLLARGFDVQCHTDTHVSFSAETASRVSEEIKQSASFIRSLGHQPWALAFPYGHEPGQPEEARQAMRACGIRAALTTRPRLNAGDADLLSLARFDMHSGYSSQAAIARVS